MKGNTNTHSKFWIGDSIFNRGMNSNSESDVLGLIAYKKAIGNFVSIITGNDVKVTFHQKENSFTDGKTVTISAEMDTKNFDSTVGLALHEASHIKLTNFDVLTRILAEDYNSPIDVEYLTRVKKKYAF